MIDRSTKRNPTIVNYAGLLLGIGYLVIFIGRLVSMFVDRSYERSNYISLATEIVLGVILVL